MQTRRDFLKRSAEGTGIVAAVNLINKATSQNQPVSQKPKAERKEPPKLGQEHSQEDGEAVLLDMVRSGSGHVKKTTAFVGTNKSHKWILTNDNVYEPLVGSLNSGGLDGAKTLTIYRMAYMGRMEKQKFDTKDARQFVMNTIGQHMYFVPDRDWDKSELVNSVYLDYKLTKDKTDISNKIVTPYGFINLKVDRNQDPWVKFAKVFEETEAIIESIDSEYPDMGKSLKMATRNSGAGTPHTVINVLNQKTQVDDLSTLDETSKSEIEKLKEHHTRLSNLVLDAEKEYSKVSNEFKTTMLAIDYKKPKAEDVLLAVEKAYDLISVKLEFNFEK